jgi:hypothetical protein
MTVDQFRVDAVARFLSVVPSRRHLLRGLAGAGIGLGVARLPECAEAKEPKKRRKKKHRQNKDAGPLCARNGERCERQGANCHASHCLKAPFTIEAIWESDAIHATYFHMPPENGATGPSPYISNDCDQSNSACAEEYPFSCVNGDTQGPGNFIATIHELLPGVYEYWLDLDTPVAAGELAIVLRDAGGRVVREWANPAHAAYPNGTGWRVFDFDGDGRVRSIDATLNGYYDPATDVCPYKTLARRDRDRASARARRDRS